ncbi:MAG: YaiO family outer membrane beta-barrel protein [Bacteroidales bacterium]|nr:YaiO family outer membrane beta-barrel protein [Bacteroidales bacterium]
MIKKIFVILLYNSLPFSALSQINADSLFNSAINHAHSQNYAEAIDNAEKVLEADSSRYGVMVFIGDVYAWDGNYNKALEYIEQARQINPEYKELYDSWLNILLWSGRYRALQDKISVAREHGYPDSYNLALKKMLAYKGLGRYSEAIDYAENNSSLLDSAAIRTIYNEMMMLDRQNILSTFYSIDIFEGNNPKPYHLAYLDYGFKIDRHTLLTRINYAHRFNTSDVQVEFDYYHVFNNGHYLYANYGIGIKNRLFPEHRAGLEYYFPVSKGLEASLGGRYLNSGSKNVYITTGHIGKYFPNLWMALRPFYVFGENGNALTNVFNIRYFQINPVNYWGVEIAYGNSPDERYAFDPSFELLRLNSYRIKIEKNIQIGQVNELKLSAGYAYEKHIPDAFSQQVYN